MSHKRQGIKILGLSLLAALGVMAVSSASASASGQWEINLTAFHGEESISVTGALGEFLVEPLGLRIHCTGAVAQNSKIFDLDKVLATLLFSGCTILGNNFCKLYETKANMEGNVNPGNIVGTGKAVLQLHTGGKHYLLFDQEDASTPFTTIFMSPGSKGCNLPLENTVTGSTVFELPDALTDQLTHLIKPLLNSEIPSLWVTDRLSYGAEAAELHGGLATVEFTGANLGFKWAAK